MATSSRDAKLVLSVESLGQENITKLEKSLRDLAATGDSSSAEFAELADQIGRLGDQNQALQAVKALQADTDALTASQTQAAATARTLAENLEGLRAATADAKREQDAARAALVAGETEYKKAGNALRELKAEYDAAGKNSAEYRTTLQRLTEEQSLANLALVELRENNRQANAAVREAAAEQGKAEGAYKRAAKQLAVSTEAADANAKALADASTEAKKLGVDTQSLADAEQGLISAFAQVTSAVNQKKEAIAEMAEFNRLAAIETKALAEQAKRGADALWAEEAALREAAKAARDYDAAKKAAADKEAAWQREAEAIVDAVHATKAAERAAAQYAETLVKIQTDYAMENQAMAAQELARNAANAARRLDDIKAACAASAEAAKELEAAADRVDAAMQGIGVGRIDAIEQEIKDTTEAMNRLAASGRLTGGALEVAMGSGQAKVAALQREMRELTGTMTMADKAAGLLKNSMGQIAAGNLIAAGIGVLVEKVKEMGRAFVVAVVELDQMRRGLNAIYKDAKVTASQVDFLRKAAKDAGVSVGSLSGEFVRFSASMNSANVPIAQSNALFASLTKAAASLGLNSDAVAGALNALGQMASKGCHAPGTLIAMHNGSTKVVEAVTVGDLLRGPDGLPRTVLKLASGVQDMYCVTPSYGHPFEVNFDHKLRLDIGGEAMTLTVRQLLAMPSEVVRSATLRHAHRRSVRFTLKRLGEGQFHGFLISGDHLYLDAQGFEHHNTVSLEELRQQLGDRLPGALGLTAKGFGITESELIKLVESGQLATRDFIVPFTQALTTMHGETTGIIATWNAFKNLLTNTAQTAGDAGGIDVMIGTLKLLKGIVGAVVITLSGLMVVLGGVGKTIGVLAGALATLTNPMDALADVAASVGARFGELGQSFKDSIGLSDAQSASVNKLQGRLKIVADETKNLTQAEKLRLLGAELLKSATEDMSAALVQYQVASAKALSEQVKLTEALGKEAKAIKDQGDAKVRITKLSGDAAAATKAEAEAATAYAAALAKEAASKQEELKLIAQEIEFTKTNLATRQLDAKATEDQTAKLREKQTIAAAETMQAKEAAEAARALAVQRRLEAETTGDQSKALETLREAMRSAQATYDGYADLYAQGLLLEEDVTQAREKLAAITYKVRDAERDRAKNSQLTIDNLRATNDLARAGLELEMAVLKAAEDKARADGNEYELKRVLIQQKELEIKMLRLTMEAKIAETNVTIANLNVKKAEIALDDPLRVQRIAAIDLSIKAAEAEMLRAKAAGESVGALERELKALKDGTAARRDATGALQGEVGARGRATAATNEQSDAMEALYMKYKLQADYSARQIELLNAEAEAAERAAEAYRKKWNIDKDGFTLNSDGQRMQQSVPTERYVYDAAKGQGLSEKQALELVDQFMQNGRPTGWNGASGLLGGSKDWFTVVNEAISKQVISNARSSAQNQGSTETGGGRAAKTLNINLRGRTTSVQVASDADANALVGVLRQLENDEGTAA